MALTGSYRINFTDPKKGYFIVEPYTANGTVTATSETLHNKATRADTSLLLYGQYVPNYGEQIHENMIRLLENFCGETEPTNAIEGQLWYDVGDSFSIIGLSATGAVIQGNQTAAFGQFAANNTTLTVWYGPLSAADNTYTSLDVRAISANINSDGETNVVFTNTQGDAYTLPAATVGGFITPAQESGLGRMRVRVKGAGDELVWADVVNVQCAPTAPPTETRMTGDLWYDTTTTVLKIYIGNNWVEITKNHLPLAGGEMSGPISMGGNVISFTGPVTSGSTLTPKTYVDATIATAVANVSSGTNAALDDLTVRMVSVETVLPDKLSRTGGNIRNALVFGDDASTPGLSAGIDMKNNAIINPLITWNAADYLTASATPNYVVDKLYVAKTMSQHLDDEIHNPDGYIQKQPDLRGLIPGHIYYVDDFSLSWERNSTLYSTFVRENAFIMQTGSNAEDAIELRHGSQPPILTDPSVAVGSNYVKSFQTLYLLDGQPQPIYGGGVTDANDDTAAASKGFVRTHVASETSGLLPVINGNFDYNAPANTYTLSLIRSGADPVSIDLYHTHKSSTLTYTYTDLGNWVGGVVDTTKEALEANGIDLTAVPISNMLTELNRQKAPVAGARFVDLPRTGSSFKVVDVSVTENGFECEESPNTLIPGMKFALEMFDSSLLFTFVEIRTVIDTSDPENPDSADYVIVEELVPTDFDPLVNQWTIAFGARPEATEGALFMTRTAHDYEVDQRLAGLTATDVGLSEVDNTADVDKPVSTATQTALDDKAPIITLATIATTGNFSSTHDAKFIEATSATGITLTIPTGLPSNWCTEIYQGGAGQVTVAPAAGVTLRSPNGAKTKGQYSVIKIRKLGTTETYVVYLDTAV